MKRIVVVSTIMLTLCSNYTHTVKSMLAVSSTLSEDVVYNMLKSLYDNGQRITAAHNVDKFIVKDTGLEGMSIKLHPEAEKYFKEIGIIK